MLLNVAIDYKTTKTMENIHWESCHSKYQDILDKNKEMYPTAEDAEKLGKDFTHKGTAIESHGCCDVSVLKKFRFRRPH